MPRLPTAQDNGKALLSALLVDSISSSFSRPATARGEAFRRFRRNFNQVFGSNNQLPHAEELNRLHCSLAQTDLDRLGYRAAVQLDRHPVPTEQLKSAWDSLKQAVPNLEILTNLDELIRTVSRRDRGAWRLFFSTRPLGPIELNLLAPATQTSVGRLAEWLRCLRGNSATAPVEPQGPSGAPIRIEWSSAPDKPLVAITSFKTSIRSWKTRVKGGRDLSIARFNRMTEIVRNVCRMEKRPHYLVFPELSIPREWIIELASALQRSGVSLIAGVEYELAVSSRRRHCHNPVFLVLRSTDLGYRSYRLLRQDKCLPAIEEESELRDLSDLTLVPRPPFDYDFPEEPRPVFQHGEFQFGILICNEMTDISMRHSFRGRVDALFVVEWNQDIKTFAPLVEATASDVHCFVVQVNNREYGDSRIRVPAKKDWERDVVRLQGGINDYVVVGELDVPALRQFQARHRPPTDEDTQFKPVPTGFRMSQWRCDNSLLSPIE
jgi:hypothetical protein